MAYDFTGLTGGIASSPSNGDLFILGYCGADSGTPGLAELVEPAGSLGTYASESDADIVDHAQKIVHGVYEAASATGGSIGAHGTSTPRLLIIMVFRNAELSTTVPFETIERRNGTTITPDPITPTEAGSLPLVSVCAGHDGGAQTWNDPGGFAYFVNEQQNDLEDVALFIGAVTGWAAGANVFPQFTHPTNGSSETSSALSMVLEPTI